MNKSLINTVSEFQEFCRDLGDTVALDFECTGLNYLEMEFVGFSLCNGQKACYVQNPKLLVYLEMMFPGKLWVMHSAVFDLKCCQKFIGCQPDRIFCTLTGARLVNENEDSHSLKFLAEHWLGVNPAEIKKYTEVCLDQESEEFIEYAQNDAIWTYQLYEMIVPKLCKEKLDYLFGIEMQFQKVLVELEINGVYIDQEKLYDFREDCGRILLELEASILDIFNLSHHVNINLFGDTEMVSPINFSSPKDLLQCIRKLGFEVDEKTPKGNPSVGKTYLQKMKGEHEFFDLLWRYRKLSKLQNSFLDPLENFVDSDGRIRPSYKMVRTGRLSCSSPNLQQLPNPKKDKLEFNHRELFLAEPGNVFIKSDFSGQELRILGEVTNDDTMVSAFQNNRDLHLTTANHIFHLGLTNEALTEGTVLHTEATKMHKEKRHQAKNGVNFPIIYGATSGRIAKDNKVSKEEAERWLNGFFELYPGVKRAIQEIPRILRRKGYVRTLYGRKRRFPKYNKANPKEKAAQERQAFNMKIQGSAADIGKIAGILLLKNLPKYAKLVLFIHDEFICEVPEDKAEECKKIIKRCMENATAFSVQMPVDAKICKSLGD